MNDSVKNMRKILNSLDETFGLEKPLSVDFLLRALMQPDSKLDRWITMNTMKEEGKAYFIDNEKLYRVIGFIHLLSRLDLESLQLSDSTTAALYDLTPILRESLKKVRAASNNNEIGDLLQFGNIERLEEFILKLEQSNEKLRAKKLIAEPISLRKVEEFRQMIAEQWRKSRTLSKVLEYFGCEIVVTDPDEKLQWVGMHRIRFKRAKIMFVERNYQKIYNIEWGHMVSDEVTKFFLQTIQKNNTKTVINSETYLEGLDKLLDMDEGINVAFISLAATIQVYRPLKESGNFTDYTEMNSAEFPFPAMGIYKERLILVPLRNKTMSDYIVGMQLPWSIVLKRKVKDAWIDGKLQVDVTEINDKNVNDTILASNPTADLNDPELIEEAKTGILIEIDELMDFEIPETNSIVVINVKERAD